MSFKRDENGSFVATKHFKMPKQVKRTLASIVDTNLHAHWKGVMKQAVMQSFEIPEKKKKNPLTGKVEVVQE